MQNGEQGLSRFECSCSGARLKIFVAMSHGSTWVWGGRINGEIASTRALDAEERMFVDVSSGVTD
jgi:hypothetical protein